MSYRIEYDGAVGKYEVRRTKSGNQIPGLILAASVCLSLLSPTVRQMLQEILIPGENMLTVSAFRTMTDDLRSGAGLYEALFDFCTMIIHGV